MLPNGRVGRDWFGVFLQGGAFSLDREALKRTGLPKRTRARVLGLEPGPWRRAPRP